MPPTLNPGTTGRRKPGYQDFVPYLSNVVNMFRKVPQPRAPHMINPVTPSTISLADAKEQVRQMGRVADKSTEGLDAHTGAAIRVGNLANTMRSLSQINAEEARTNAGIRNQALSLNANIDAMNAAALNRYEDDKVNAQIARQREQSENLANFSDKIIGDITRRDMMNLERDKAATLSRMYDQGVYERLLEFLKKEGVAMPGEKHSAGGRMKRMYAAGGKLMRPFVDGGGDPATDDKKKKKSQPAPVYTSDPNDPRLRAYKDSLILYQATLNDRKVFGETGPRGWWQYTEEWPKKHPLAQGAFDRLTRLNKRAPTGTTYGFVTDNSLNFRENDGGVEYKKPVQPVIYQPERNLPAAAVQGTAMTALSSIKTPVRVSTLQPSATDYSVTVRDEDAPGKQRSVYFRDRKAWRNFLDSGIVSLISSSETGGKGTAAGYRTRKYGGKLIKPFA